MDKPGSWFLLPKSSKNMWKSDILSNDVGLTCIFT